MILPFFLYILICLWVIHTVEKILYCFYFWQLKEYRFDRIKGDFKRSLKIFVPKVSLLLFLVLLLSLLIKSDPQAPYSWEDLVVVVFYVITGYSLVRLFQQKWRLPKLTKKMYVLLLISVSLIDGLAIIFSNYFILFIVFAEILIPFATFSVVQLFQVPTRFGKKLIYKKAENKISQMRDLNVIGISGSYGKSSTKEFLYTILSQKYYVLKTSGNINSEIGVAQTIISDLHKDHKIFIVEMGAYRKGEISLMCKIAKPKIGIVTGVNEQHLALFGTMENLLSAEGGQELADALPENGLLILNGENKYCLALHRKTDKNNQIYALCKKELDADIWTEDMAVHKDGISFVAVIKSGEMAHFYTKVLGAQNIENLLAAILVAKHLGMSLADIAKACEKIEQNQAGMVLEEGKHGINIINSSYSANPDGVIADLEYLNTYQDKKVLVMPCLIELGKKSAEIHERIGHKIAQVCNVAIITTKDNFAELKKGAMAAGMNEKDIILCNKPDDIYSIITLFCKAGDAVLLEGRVPASLIKLLAE